MLRQVTYDFASHCLGKENSKVATKHTQTGLLVQFNNTSDQFNFF